MPKVKASKKNHTRRSSRLKGQPKKRKCPPRIPEGLPRPTKTKKCIKSDILCRKAKLVEEVLVFFTTEITFDFATTKLWNDEYDEIGKCDVIGRDKIVIGLRFPAGAYLCVDGNNRQYISNGYVSSLMSLNGKGFHEKVKLDNGQELRQGELLEMIRLFEIDLDQYGL